MMTSKKEPPEKKKRMVGFACMSPEKRRELGRLGGKAVQESGKAHRFTSEEARELGRLGGKAGRNRSKKRVSAEEVAAFQQSVTEQIARGE